ncbi:hypothetical protein QE152_g34163 [Popillia japonica]|uniref:Uncharacterized protein n=1 Tax=Popillia japonica TaxID=7064 RepID=A0AAW1IU98_POPJA
MSKLLTTFKFLWISYTVFIANHLKPKRELAECASELDLELNKIGRVLGTRWVSSSFKTVTAVKQNWSRFGYQALHSQFKKAQEDVKNRTTTILAELSMVSKCLQSRQTTVVYADKLIRRSIAFFECLIVKPGTKSLGTKRAAIEGNFCGIPLTSSSKITAINHQQLLSSVINNLNTTRSSNEPSTGTSNHEKE